MYQKREREKEREETEEILKGKIRKSKGEKAGNRPV